MNLCRHGATFEDEAAALGNTVGLVANFYSHEWAKVRQGWTDKAIQVTWRSFVIRVPNDRMALKSVGILPKTTKQSAVRRTIERVQRLGTVAKVENVTRTHTEQFFELALLEEN